MRLDNVGDDSVTVESNATFSLQAYRLWNRLVASNDATWKDEAPQAEAECSPASSSSSDSSSSGSDASSSSSDTEPPDVESENEDADPPAADSSNALTVDDIEAMLKQAQAKGQVEAGARLLASLAVTGAPATHPKRLAGKKILWSHFVAAAKRLAIAVPDRSEV